MNEDRDLLVDPPDVIQKCLNCDKPKCNDCMRYRGAKKKSRGVHPPPGTNLEDVIRLYNEGMAIDAMSEELGVTYSSMKYFVLRSGLPMRREGRPHVTPKHWKRELK